MSSEKDPLPVERPTEKLVWVERRPHALVRQFRLTAIAGPDAGRSCSARKARATIGTHESNDLVLSDRSVSRFHCEVVWDDDRPRIRDLGSSNATLVDGVSVLEAHLPEGAVVTLGASRVRFDIAGEPVQVPVSGRDSFGGLVGGSVGMRA